MGKDPNIYRNIQVGFLQGLGAIAATTLFALTVALLLNVQERQAPKEVQKCSTSPRYSPSWE